MEAVDVSSLELQSSSPRSTLAWKDDWGDECALSEPSKIGRGSSLVGPRTPPQHKERPCRSLSAASPSSSANSTVEPAALDQWHYKSPPSPTHGSFEVGKDEDACKPQVCDRGDVWLRGSSTPQSLSRTSSTGCTSADEDGLIDRAAAETGSVASSSSSSTWVGTVLNNRAQFMTSVNEDLASLKSCAKRAIDLGKKVQQYGAAEVLKLRAEKVRAVVAAQKLIDVNTKLENQLIALRDEKEKLELERQAEVVALNAEKQKLVKERDALQVEARKEKKKRERVQKEKDCILKGILHGEATEMTVRDERKKLEAMEIERDAAVKTLQDERDKLDAERDAMLCTVRDLRLRLELEHNSKLTSMRRSSLDVGIARMNSGFDRGDRNRCARVNQKDPFPWKK